MSSEFGTSMRESENMRGRAPKQPATTAKPITAFNIVVEMASCHSSVLSLVVCAWQASAVSRLVTRPMHCELAMELPLPPATVVKLSPLELSEE